MRSVIHASSVIYLAATRKAMQEWSSPAILTLTAECRLAGGFGLGTGENSLISELGWNHFLLRWKGLGTEEEWFVAFKRLPNMKTGGIRR